MAEYPKRHDNSSPCGPFRLSTQRGIKTVFYPLKLQAPLVPFPVSAGSRFPPPPTLGFRHDKFLQNSSPAPNCFRGISLNLFWYQRPSFCFRVEIGRLSAHKKIANWSRGLQSFVVSKNMCGRWRGAWVRPGWHVWDLGNGMIMLRKVTPLLRSSIILSPFSARLCAPCDSTRRSQIIPGSARSWVTWFLWNCRVWRHKPTQSVYWTTKVRFVERRQGSVTYTTDR